MSKTIQEDDELGDTPISVAPPEQEEEPEVFAITVSDFEKEYIVD